MKDRKEHGVGVGRGGDVRCQHVRKVSSENELGLRRPVRQVWV